MAYTVTGALVRVEDEAGRHQYFYQGAPLPDYVSADEVKRLQDLNLVSKGDADAVAKENSKAAASARQKNERALSTPTGDQPDVRKL